MSMKNCYEFNRARHKANGSIYIDTLQSPLATRVAFLKAMGDPFLGCADAIGMSSVAAGE